MSIEDQVQGAEIIQVAMGDTVTVRSDVREAFVVSARQSDVSSYAREGDDLIITFQDGAQVRINGFAISTEDQLVFLDGDMAYVAGFTNAWCGEDGVADACVTYTLLEEDSNLGWILLALLGGILAAAALSNGDDDDTKPSVAINSITDDNILSGTEIKDSISVTGTIKDVPDNAANRKVVVTVNGKEYTATINEEADGSLTWKVDVPGSELAADTDKTIEAQLIVTDEDGNEQPYDTSKAYTVDAGNVSVSIDDQIAGDGYINASEQGKVTLSGVTTGVENGRLVTLTISDTDGSTPDVTVTATVEADADNNGIWTVTADLSKLADGKITVRADVSNAAGTTASDTEEATKDVVGPGGLTDLNLIDDVGNLRGSIPKGGSTDDSRPTYSGKLVDAPAAGDKITINVYDNNVLIGTTAVKADGSWSFEPTTILTKAAHKFTAEAVDEAGNVGAKSDEWEFSVTGTPPATPAIEEMFDDVGTITGYITEGQTTDDRKPKISGTGTSGSTVTVYVKGENEGEDKLTPIGTTTVGTDGNWTFTPATDITQNGGVDFRADATMNGEKSDMTGPHIIVLDTTKPNAKVPSADDDVGDKKGTISPGDETDDTQPEFKGSGEPGSTITIYDGADKLGTTTVSDKGDWTFTPTDPLDDSEHDITVTETDKAGNTSDKSDPLTFTVDSKNVVVTILHAVDSVHPGSADQIIADKGKTNDTTPTLVGKATAGITVTVTEGSTLLGATTADSNGNWRLELQEQTPTAHHYTATAVNRAGTNGSDTFDLNIDTTASGVPSIGNVDDNVGSVQGHLTKGDSTDDTVPTMLSGDKATPGEIINVYDNDALLGTTEVKTDGTWVFEPAGNVLNEGSHDLRVSVTDDAGNESAKSEIFNIIVDTTAPTAIAKLSAIQDDNGPEANDFITNDQTLIVKATVTGALAADERIQISLGDDNNDGKQDWHDATLVGNGIWQYDAQKTELAHGTYTFEARAVDKAGNTGTETPTKVEIDTKVDSVTIDITGIDEDTGNKGDFITSDRTLKFFGTIDRTLTASEVVQISLDDGQTWKIASVNDKTWNYDNTANTMGGKTVIHARVVDLGGNVEGTDKENLEVDSGPAPKPPAITGVMDDVLEHTGNIPPDGVTNDRTPTVIGTSEAGLTVTVYVDDDGDGGKPPVAMGVTTVDSAGKWSVVLDEIKSNGKINITADAMNTSGRRSDPTGDRFVTLDADSPDAAGKPIGTDDIDPVKGTIADKGATNDSQPEFSGKLTSAQGEQGDVISIYDGTTLLGTTAVGTGGAWTFTTPSSKELNDGDHSITTKVTDKAGNTGPSSDALTFTVDTTGRTVTISHAVDDKTPVESDDLASGAVTNDDTPKLVGKATAGTTVTITEGATVLGTVVADANENWSFTTPLQADGKHTYTASVESKAGAKDSATFELTIDTKASGVPVIGSVSDDVGYKQGTLVQNERTDDTTPTLRGTAKDAADGDTINVYDNGALLGTTTVDKGEWSYTPPPTHTLNEGPHSLEVSVTDKAGNESGKSPAFNLVVDVTGPSSTAKITGIDEDRGIKADDFLTSDNTLVIKAGLTGALETGDKVQISLGDDNKDGIIDWHDASLVNGVWQYDATSRTLADGTYTFIARTIDIAGNSSTESETKVVIETGKPTSKATIDTYTDDVGDKQGNFGSGTTTDDKSIVLNGKVTAATLEVDDRIAVYNDGKLLGYADLDAKAGTWTYEVDNLVNKTDYKFTANVTDAAGNDSPIPSDVFTLSTNQDGIDVKIFIEGVGGSKWWHETNTDDETVGTNDNNDFIGITGTDFFEVDGMAGGGFNTIVFEANNLTLNVAQMLQQDPIPGIKRIQQFDLNNQLNTEDTGPNGPGTANDYDIDTTGNKLILSFDDVEVLVGQYKDEDANKDGKPDVFSTNFVVSGTTSATHMTILGDNTSTVELDAGWAKTSTNTMNIYNGLGSDAFTYENVVFDVWHHSGSNTVYDLLIMQGVVVNVG
ncbi:MAG: Ig-like domain-containing protein [Burkholderiaceae bacterium]|jgi:hypothetical protein|nr:Ig-like domain-containing protein [Burkholderiaceae bacterium]